MNKSSEILLKLVSENPGLDILPLVSEDAGGDGCYGLGSFSKPSVEKYVFGSDYVHVGLDDERIYIRSTDEDDMRDLVSDANEELTDDEVLSVINDLAWQKAIFVYIEAF